MHDLMHKPQWLIQLEWAGIVLAVVIAMAALVTIGYRTGATDAGVDNCIEYLQTHEAKP